MTSHTTTVPAFVRTEAGTVRVDAGDQIPDDTLPTEIARLVAAGVIVEDAPHAIDETAAASPATPRGKSRGQSGTTKGR